MFVFFVKKKPNLPIIKKKGCSFKIVIVDAGKLNKVLMRAVFL